MQQIFNNYYNIYMKLLKKYFKIVKEIYTYFNYEGGQQIYPIEDYTEFYWQCNNNFIFYSEDKKNVYDDEYLDKYIGEEYTMFLIKDTHNLDDCLIIFDNQKQIFNNE